MTPNQKAFLDMLAFSEGTIKFGDQDGYNVIVGGALFDDYSDHPRVLVNLPRLGIKSTAAGRYQLLARYYDAYKKLLRLPDFSPASQDAIALQQIKERRALPDIEAGRFDDAVRKCKNIWASLPGAGYGQHEQKIQALRDAYADAGGTFA
jgi:muramidase (phage lysozyme)